MRRKLRFENSYPVSADRLFALVTDLDTLEAVSKPWVQLHHLPSGQVRAGQTIDVAMSLFGLFPGRPYRMSVILCDPVTRLMRSEERGMGVQRLTHDLSVRSDGNGAVLVDQIEIEAGWRTPFIVVCAWFAYRWRHHVRLRLLKTA